MHDYRRRKNVLFIHMYEVEIPLTLNAVSVKDRASFIKILIEVICEYFFEWIIIETESCSP